MGNPYALETDRLLDEFMRATARAGVSRSGLAIIIGGDDSLEYAHYLKGVVRARIDDVQPPIQPGAQVKPTAQLTAPAQSNDWKRSKHERELPPVMTVDQVYYLGENTWNVTFRERTATTADGDWDEDGRIHYIPLRFRASDFEILVPAGV